MKLLRRLFRDEDGPTSVEYAVMLALIISACATAITLMGTTTGASFGSSRDQITSAMNP